MKNLILISALLSVFSVSAVASDLPACDERRTPYEWDNCYGPVGNDSKYGRGYVGEWKDGLYHGQGTLESWLNSYKYVGEFKFGNKHGQGTLTWNDGRKYVGEFNAGIRTGQGVLTLSDGSVQSGVFENNKYLGTKEFVEAKREAERKKKEAERKKKEAQKMIYDNCLIDLMPSTANKDLSNSILAKCTRISENPSMWQKWKYSD